MCSHYQAVKKADQLEKYFRARGQVPPKTDMWPRYAGVFVRRPPEWESGDEAVPEREAVVGRWGLISAMTKPDDFDKAGKLSTFNARDDRVSTAFTHRNAWHRAQHCIIPADWIFEPDWRPVYEGASKGPVPTRFTRADGAPLGIAGLWDRVRTPAGDWLDTYAMVTINADQHELFKHYHKREDEKRMVVILPDGAYGDWLAATAEQARDFLLPYPGEKLVAEPIPPKEKALF
jgi:putative SOS response-associated peptidase YedK